MEVAVTARSRGKPKSKSARPKISFKNQLKLWVASGGRCAFPGCNDRVDIDPLTLSEVNHSNIAHIVGAKDGGPRGDFPIDEAERHSVSNLMLLCSKCHVVIDDKKLESKYPVELLRQYKRAHESRIDYLTGLSAGHKTVAVRCRANILNEVVQIPVFDMVDAVLPFYPEKDGVELDLTRMAGDDTPEYWASKKSEIKKAIEKALGPKTAAIEIEHLSVFALGPMPLLMHLGNCLSNKIPTELYQRHRDTEKWKWKEGVPNTKFKIEKIRSGTDSEKAALLLSLSGVVQLKDLPAEIDNDHSVYVITLADETPRPTFLNGKESLSEFKLVYRSFLSELRADHPELKNLKVFPAVPAPIAVLCGRELIQKVDPVLRIYDFNKSKDGFEFTLEVNDGRE